jgi:hypothetical protein
MSVDCECAYDCRSACGCSTALHHRNSRQPHFTCGYLRLPKPLSLSTEDHPPQHTACAPEAVIGSAPVVRAIEKGRAWIARRRLRVFDDIAYKGVRQSQAGQDISDSWRKHARHPLVRMAHRISNDLKSSTGFFKSFEKRPQCYGMNAMGAQLYDCAPAISLARTVSLNSSFARRYGRPEGSPL